MPSVWSGTARSKVCRNESIRFCSPLLRARKQFGGHEQVGLGAARDGLGGKKRDRISATTETIDQD
jgi:hypothetical protein